MSYLPGKAQSAAKQAPETVAIPQSSFLQSATYDAQNYSLTLDFKNGTSVVHKFVFPMVWQMFKETSSHGSFYARQIKGKYPSIKTEGGLMVSDFTKAMKQVRGK